ITTKACSSNGYSLNQLAPPPPETRSNHHTVNQLIVPTLCVGMHPVTLCVTSRSGTRSVPGDIPTQERGNDQPLVRYSHFVQRQVGQRKTNLVYNDEGLLQQRLLAKPAGEPPREKIKPPPHGLGVANVGDHPLNKGPAATTGDGIIQRARRIQPVEAHSLLLGRPHMKNRIRQDQRIGDDAKRKVDDCKRCQRA
ncbi:hypothetical protein SAMN03159386_00866, partial [Pseudomonas sp. NFACC17-2]